MSYIWFNTLNGDSVELNVTFFEKQGNTYNRYDEKQVQYIHSLEFVKEILKANKFNIVSVTEELGNDLKEDSLRQIFIAIKN